MRAATAGVLILSWLTFACGSDAGEDEGGAPPPTVALGETDAIDGAGSPAGWLLLDEPSFVIRDFAAGSGQALVLVGSLYERDFVFGGATHPSFGGSDGLIGTLSIAGQAGWSRSFGSADADEALSIAIRPSGNLVVGGFFRQSIDLGAGALTDLRTQAGFSDPYFDFDTGALLVFELDAQGALVWSRAITSASGEGAVSAVALAENGDAVVAGYASGDLDFGAGMTSGDGIFVARFGPSGEHVSSSRFPGPSALVHGIAVDSSGVVLAGSYEGTVDLGGGPLLETGPDADGFVARIDTTGALSWALRFGGESDDRAVDVVLAPDGTVFACGFFSRMLDLAEPVARENETGFAVRIAANGTVDWARAFGGSGRSRATSLVMDDAGRIVVGGGYRDGVDLGGGELLADTDDGFLTGMGDTDGAHLFSRRIARFNFGGLVRRESQLFVAGTCEGVCAIGGEIVPPSAAGRLLVAELSTEPESHVARWALPAELNVEGEAHAVRSAIALAGSAPENPSGVTLVLSAAEIDCSTTSQLPRSVASGTMRRSDPELALLLPSAELRWQNVTSWLSYGGGGRGGSTLVLVERISETEIEAYVEHHVESTGSSATESYVMGQVTFRRCF